MEKLETLKVDAALKRIALNKVLNKIRKAESELNTPQLNKKYLGKCFKTKNSYGGDRKPWFMYEVVDSIIYPNEFKGRRFQTTEDGQRIIEFKLNGYLSLLGKEITKTEFNKQFDMMKQFISEKF